MDALEENLELVEDGPGVLARGGQLAEGVGLVCAPEEAAGREALLPVEVAAHSNEVVRLHPCNGHCQKHTYTLSFPRATPAQTE